MIYVIIVVYILYGSIAMLSGTFGNDQLIFLTGLVASGFAIILIEIKKLKK